MSMPEYGLNMDVRAASAPIDTENGLESAFPSLTLMASSGVTNRTGAWCVSATCSKENMIRFMTWADYLFSEEGSMIKTYGFTGDLAAADPLYQQLGLEKGTYWFDENGDFHQDPRILSNEIDPMGLSGNRLPGVNIKKYTYPQTEQSWLDADKVWSRYGDAGDYPVNATGTAEEESQLADYYNTYTDYQNSMVVKFIMGTEELTPESYNAYVEQMNKFGVEDSIRIKQEIYNRFMSF
jgi:putative aldouronate transport system substrate-binding protein